MTESDPGREQRLANVLLTLADTMVTDFDIADLFHDLVHGCVDLLDVSAAGLMLVDTDEQLRGMASSSEQSRLLELMELHIDQGPCLDCHRTGAPVFVPDLAAQHTRWPGFAEQTLQVGFGAVYALPMRLRQDTIGSLNLFHRDPGTISPATLGLAQSLADVATIAILQHRALVASAELSEQLQRALQGRIVIEQAKGVLAGREQIEIPAAFALMRAYSRHTNRALRQVAHDVVAGELDAAQLRSGAGPTPPAPRPTSAPRRAGIPPRQERDG